MSREAVLVAWMLVQAAILLGIAVWLVHRSKTKISFTEDQITQMLATSWSTGYLQGVGDEMTSREWTDGQVPPARVNPYTGEQMRTRF